MKLTAIDKTNLSEQTKFRLSEIIGIENYFHQKINQRKSCNKKLNKYAAVFNYIDQALIVLKATSGGVSIISFTNVNGAPVGIASASFTLIFSVTTGIVKKLLNITRNKKKKYDKILMLPKSKLNSIRTLISQALINMETSHDTSDFVLKTKYNTDKTELENKIPDTSGLVRNTDHNAKITDIESKIPDVRSLATKTALTTVENIT